MTHDYHFSDHVVSEATVTVTGPGSAAAGAAVSAPDAGPRAQPALTGAAARVGYRWTRFGPGRGQRLALAALYLSGSVLLSHYWLGAAGAAARRPGEALTQGDTT